MMTYLAEAAAVGPDPMISGTWIIGLIGTLTTLLSLFYGKRQGMKKAANNVTLQNPMPEVPTRKVLTPPSWDAHQALRDRVAVVEAGVAELRRETTSQYHELLKAGGERETHLSDKLDGIARGIHSRIDEILTSIPQRTRTR